MERSRHGLDNFEQVVAEHRQMVFRTAVGFVHCPEDAEDITQEVFLKAWKSWGSFRGEAAVATWLYRIAVNLSINYAAYKKRRAHFSTEEIPLSPVEKEDDPQRLLERDETQAAVRDAIDSLPDRQRVAFVLSRYDDLSQREVAAVMKLSEGAVEQLLQRARINLQQKLKNIVGK